MVYNLQRMAYPRFRVMVMENGRLSFQEPWLLPLHVRQAWCSM